MSNDSIVTEGAKLTLRSEEFNAVSQFFEYLAERNLSICKLSEGEDDYRWMPLCQGDYNDLLYDFIGIDQFKLENERRELLGQAVITRASDKGEE